MQASRTMSESRPEERQAQETEARPGFLRRYRLPLFLAVVALCLYAGSIIYIIYFRGQVA